ncbi:ABC transporter ATP-binding protein [Paraburkholderia sp. ZP32-5]|uniref:ABC transporter ATP-binding protein n=1 Tax=Paraburkholderia sp. ZP32-5 TaxID=2883245 RepID=UPI001F331363|nr:ABC transporter ATP-binding protein [Paraburkholderia sp. ZP32-5]
MELAYKADMKQLEPGGARVSRDGVAGSDATVAPILEVRGVTKRYDDTEVLRAVDLSIAEGEFVTLLGPSGSGKTTLLKIMLGATTPSEGTLVLRGRDITNEPARRRGIGMVFQNFALMPHMTVFQNIAFPLQVRGVSKRDIESRVHEVLELVRLPDLARRKPKELSGGQQQRIAIARALVYRPPLILMDEPLGALDKKLREQMQYEIKRLHETLKLSMVYVTHDQEEALTLSDRICLMQNGRICEAARPASIYAKPQSRFTADFFGATNLFTGVVTEQAGRAVITVPSWPDPVCAEPRAAAMAASGARAKINWMVRPERLRLLEPGQHDINEVEGIVQSVVLSGSITRVSVRMQHGAEIVVAQLTDQSAVAIERGAQVRVGWPQNATVMLDSDPTASPGINS